MKHLSPKQVLQARHYHAAGWSVAELARLLGHTRDTISKVVNGHTHTNVVRPEGYVVPQLPSRPPKPQWKPRTLEDVAPGLTREEAVQRYYDRQHPKPVPQSPSERVLAEARAHPTDPRDWERLKAQWREDELKRRAAAAPPPGRTPRRSIPSDW